MKRNRQGAMCIEDLFPLSKSVLKFLHFLEACIVGTLAGTLAFGVYAIGIHSIASSVLRVPYLNILLDVFAIGILAGIAWPSFVLSIWAGFRLIFTFKASHFGLVFKCFVAGGAFFWMASQMLGQWQFPNLLQCADIVLALLVLSLGLGIGIFISKRALSKEESQTSYPWWFDDQPVRTEAESCIETHPIIARKLLSYLSVESSSQGLLPSVALIGPPGSGKTGICNIAQDICKRDRSLSRKTIFCRFEAWRYVTKDAALRGLIEVASSAVLAHADVSELWLLPNEFLAVMSDSVGTFGRVLSNVLRIGTRSGKVLHCLGKTLRRLDMRLVVFVDDLDRVEASVPEVEDAVIQALNEFQQVPNVQYVISVGPEARSNSKLDLVKLTRFQLYVPALDSKVVFEAIVELRNKCLSNSEYYFPWNELHEGGIDPLIWNNVFGARVMSPSVQAVWEVVDSPRSLKGMLRETEQLWSNGLCGELNWYDLLLISCLKTCESGLFSWIARSQGKFYEQAWLSFLKASGKDGKKEHSVWINDEIGKRLTSRSPDRKDAIMEMLYHLFPEFAGRLGRSVSRHEWEQYLGQESEGGPSYLERYFLSHVEEDRGDRKVLQYIRKIQKASVDRNEFERLYLDTLEKQTGCLNKFVQFAGLLEMEKAFEVASVIFDWIAVPEHAQIWNIGLDKYYQTTLLDIRKLFREAGKRAQITRELVDEKGKAIFKWLESKIHDRGAHCFHVLAVLLKMMSPDSRNSGGLISKEEENTLEKRFGIVLRGAFLEKEDCELPNFIIQDQGFFFNIFVKAIASVDGHDTFREMFTQKLVVEAEKDTSGWLKCYMIDYITETPNGANVVDDHIDVADIRLKRNIVKRDFNESILVNAVGSWRGDRFPDSNAQWKLEAILRAYPEYAAIGMSNLPDSSGEKEESEDRRVALLSNAPRDDGDLGEEGSNGAGE